MKAECPRYTAEVIQMKQSSKMEEFYEKYDEAFLNYIEEHTGMKIPRNDAVLAISALGALYDTLFVQVLTLGKKNVMSNYKII